MRKLLIGTGFLVAVFVAAPILIVVPMSFSTAPSLEFPPPGYWLGYYRDFFTDITWLRPTANSFVIAAVTTLTTLALVTPASFAMVRHRFPGRGLLNLALLLPLAVPHIVMAVGYYSFLGRFQMVQSYLGVIVAHTCLTVPICFLTVTAALKGFDRNLERAAQNLGAPPAKAFFLITLPVLRPAFLVSGLLTFVYSFDETVVAIFISGRDAETLPRKMFDSIRMQADPVLSVVSTLLFALVLAAVISATLWRVMADRQARRRRQAHRASAAGEAAVLQPG